MAISTSVWAVVREVRMREDVGYQIPTKTKEMYDNLLAARTMMEAIVHDYNFWF